MGKLKLFLFYLTPKVYAGIQKGVIVASAVDSMVIQGRIAVDQAVRSLEKQFLAKHIGPNIFMLDNKTIKKSRMDDILPPVNFKAEFSVP